MHPALRKRPLFTKKIPIFHFFSQPAQFYFLSTGLYSYHFSGPEAAIDRVCVGQ